MIEAKEVQFTMMCRRRFLKVAALGVCTLALDHLMDTKTHGGDKAVGQARSLTPDAAKALLEEGNMRYRKGACIGPAWVSSDQRHRSDADLSKGPYAIILTCSDSRVAPELIFNASPGALIVIRTSGNLVDPYVLGSIEQALDRFHIPLLLVMSHDDCHALQAAVRRFEHRGSIEPRWVNTLITGLMPSVTQAKKRSDLFGRRLAEVATVENARLQAKKIVSMSELVRQRVSNGSLKVMSGHYHLDTGMVEIKS